ncbi:MAG: kinase [Oligoflexia bacterium]|nr:kinase [Oligoflexia bacterium]
MRVDILINPRARSINGPFLERELRSALFRCDLRFHSPMEIEETQQLIRRTALEGTDFFVVCGGDGTLNVAIHPLMKLQLETGKPPPPLCVVPSGTANDFATEFKLSRRIRKAVRAILEGGVRTVDILEISAGARTSYMITNGGVGIASQTAEAANLVRSWVRSKAESPETPLALRPFFKLARTAVHAAGSRIYELLLVKELSQWDTTTWEVEIDIPGRAQFSTKTPFILINNQPSLAGKFRVAPFTSNGDGTFNILIVEASGLLPQVKTILDIRMGKIPDLGECPSFETDTIRLRALESSRPMTFFGDGEILLSDARQITIRCLHPGLPIVTGECAEATE